MAKSLNDTLLDCLQLMLRPVAWFCVQRSLGLQDLVELAKVTLLEAAENELKRQGHKINYSRLSAMSGVHRKDVVRIYKKHEVQQTSSRFSSRVVGRWREDPRFTTKNKRPRVLTLQGEDSEFKQLVRSISSDIRPSAVLFDLERIKAVERVKNGLKLTVKAYVPRNDPVEAFGMMAEDAEDLMYAVTENAFNQDDELPNYHASSIYDNVSPEDLPKIRRWMLKQCSKFQERVEKYLSEHDLDVNPDPDKEGGARISLCIFSRT